MKRIGCCLLALCLLLPGIAPAESDGCLCLVVSAYSFGPGVSGLILSLERPVFRLEAEELRVTIGGAERDIDALSPCDARGCPVPGPSAYWLIALSAQGAMRRPLMAADPATGWKDWIDACPVSLEGELLMDGEKKQLLLAEDCISRRVCPDGDLFSLRLAYTGESLNAFTGEMERQTIRLAAYEPEALRGGAPNPLLIWLHGAGEGGPCLDAAVLGNEVSLLAKEQIQSHFSAADGTSGTYVLLPQCDTLWMDEGDGQNSQGTGVSRYTKTLMDAIGHYLDLNPDVNRNRIYLGGCSNGGYMTLNLLAEYPGVFAAAFPVCEAYDTSDQERRIGALAAQPIWFVQSADDNVVDPERYVIPTYVDLMFEEAEDCWLSMFIGYRHAVWSAVFHDLVNGVQDPEEVFMNMEALPDREKGGECTAGGAANLFDWLNIHDLRDRAEEQSAGAE